MGRLRVVFAIAALAVLSAAVVVPLASAGSPPLAEAGLDQQVVRGATVYLDAGGSSDPDGTIQGFAWTVTRPDGTTTAPDCRTCERTQFTPTQTGEYAVAVTVTGSDGDTASDTLYVAVAEPTDATVELTGPVRVEPGVNVTYTATMQTDGALRRFTWTQNGSRVAGQHVTGSNATVTLNRTFDETGRYLLRGTVRTRQGTSHSDNVSVVVEELDDAGGGAEEVCPNGHPIHNGPNGQLSACRQSAIELIGDQIMAVPSANPNSVIFRANNGSEYKISHENLQNKYNIDPNSELIPKKMIVTGENKDNSDLDNYREEYERRPTDYDRNNNRRSDAEGDCYAPCY